VSVARATPAAPPDLRARWLLVGMHVPFVAYTAAHVTLGFGGYETRHWPLGLLLLLAAATVQLRHSVAAAAGARPRHWPLTLLLLFALAYVPTPLFGYRWMTLQWLVIASAAMLLPRRAALATVAAVLVAGVVLGNGMATTARATQWTSVRIAWNTLYFATVLLVGGGGLYAAARLALIIRELRHARAELRDEAIARERLRISRDLHDLLGHSLSAISLKADLAAALLARGSTARATDEVRSLLAVASSALDDLRALPHAEPPVSLANEIDRAGDLLKARQVRLTRHVAPTTLSPAAAEVLGWAVREAVTNLLRHSAATACTISVRREGRQALLEVENDGARPPAGGGAAHAGSGLAGLAARAAAVGGTARGLAMDGGRFRVEVRVPEGPA
jgi:two-component system, NarL family, sensor histidine kinase DesK